MICFECYESYLYNILIHCNISYVDCFILELFYLVKTRCPTVNVNEALPCYYVWTYKMVNKRLSAKMSTHGGCGHVEVSLTNPFMLINELCRYFIYCSCT